MESGTGVDRDTTRSDALLEDAKAAVAYSANELRSITARAREAAGRMRGRASTGEDALEHEERVARLEVAVSSLERLWLFLGGNLADVLPEAADTLAVAHAREAERARIARELHDGPAQSLANAAFQVDIVERLLERDPDAARAELSVLRRSLEREIAELRGLIGLLRPSVLEEVGLDAALRAAAVSLTPDHDVEIELGATGDGLDPAEQVVALRIAQEALRNIRKHAAARRVTLTTASTSEGWVLEVRDDGSGFDVAAALAAAGGRSFGLRFMRERAESVGGQLTIDSGANGTRVRLTMNPSGRRSSAW